MLIVNPRYISMPLGKSRWNFVVAYHDAYPSERRQNIKEKVRTSFGIRTFMTGGQTYFVLLSILPAIKNIVMNPIRNPNINISNISSISIFVRFSCLSLLSLALDDLAASVHRGFPDAGLVEPVVRIVSARTAFLLDEVLLRGGEDEPPAAHRNTVADGIE